MWGFILGITGSLLVGIAPPGALAVPLLMLGRIAAIFTALSGGADATRWLDGVITFAGRQDNLAVRRAALIALAFNLLMVVAAIVSIMVTVPRAQKRGDMP